MLCSGTSKQAIQSTNKRQCSAEEDPHREGRGIPTSQGELHMKEIRMLVENLELNPKGDQSGCSSSFILPLKETIPQLSMTVFYLYLYTPVRGISSHTTPSNTSMVKILAFSVSRTPYLRPKSAINPKQDGKDPCHFHRAVHPPPPLLISLYPNKAIRLWVYIFYQ